MSQELQYSYTPTPTQREHIRRSGAEAQENYPCEINRMVKLSRFDIIVHLGNDLTMELANVRMANEEGCFWGVGVFTN